MTLADTLRELNLYIDPEEFSKHVSEKDGKIEVNWTALEELGANGGYANYCNIMLALTHLGILSAECAKGTFYVSGSGVPLNPIANGAVRYFTRREDAEAFKEIKSKRYYETRVVEGR